MPFKTLLVAILAIVTLQGCVYRMDIPQGNRIDEEKLDQLKLGMTRSQVEFLIGSPAVVDPYHPHIASYVNYLYKGKEKTEQVKTMVLTYDDKDVLTKIDGKL
jgi:outer membrane protein assembly factor BamE